MLKMTAEEFDAVIDTDLRGVFLCDRAAAREMKERGGGIILNVVSNVAFHGTVGQSNYAASKAALILAWSVGSTRLGIRFNGISPIAVTDMTQVAVDRAEREARERGLLLPTAREVGLGDPDAVEPVVAYLASDAAWCVPGQMVTFNGMRLALWSHSYEAVIDARAEWILADIAERFADAEGFPLQEQYVPEVSLQPAT